jgi:cytidylate kinase
VAIDGPAGSGKSSTAREVSRRLGFVYVDSGAVYRACALVALDTLGDPETWTAEAVVGTARARGIAVRAESGAFEVTAGGLNVEPAIRSARVTEQASRVATMGPVRDFVNSLLRAAAVDGGVVMDGRDIGTVVFPDAEVKIFMVAHPEERARRRLAEKGEAVDRRSLEVEAGALQARDARDSRRDLAPLQMAEGATVIDTSELSFEDQVALAVDLAGKAERRP